MYRLIQVILGEVSRGKFAQIAPHVHIFREIVFIFKIFKVICKSLGPVIHCC